MHERGGALPNAVGIQLSGVTAWAKIDKGDRIIATAAAGDCATLPSPLDLTPPSPPLAKTPGAAQVDWLAVESCYQASARMPAPMGISRTRAANDTIVGLALRYDRSA